MKITVGVLALQGGFQLHIDMLQDCAQLFLDDQLHVISVRTSKELSTCDALVIPGGESTTMLLLAQKSSLLDDLRHWVLRDGRPTWGTCAGMILLAQQTIEPYKQVEQASIGGVDVCVVRNQYGRQLSSFEHDLHFEGISDADRPFKAIFIRAPMVHHLLPSKHTPITLATVSQDCLPSLKATSFPLGPDASIVALRQSNSLVTSFHPELGQDSRVHQYWLKEIVLPALQSQVNAK